MLPSNEHAACGQTTQDPAARGYLMSGDVSAPSLIVLGVFVVLSAFFSGSEAALLSVQRVRIHHLVNSKVAGAARVLRMIERPDKLLPPILLGNNLVNTAAAALATALALDLIADPNRAVVIATAVVTVILLIFGETIPKTVAARHAERVSIIVSLPIQAISRIMAPASFLLERISRVASLLLGGVGRTGITEEEIKAMVSVGKQEGAVREEEAEMIRRVLEFGDRRVREVMTPRPEVVWVELGTTIKEFLALYDTHYHTQFPVCQGEVDNVIGLIAVKDIVRSLSQGAAMNSSATVKVRPARFVPETKPVEDLFVEMRDHGDQMAMIADEFGGVAGVVTLKRLVEDIVGRARDEESPVEPIRSIGLHTHEIDGSVSIGEVNAKLAMAIPHGDYETVAGFLLEQLGSVPETGTVVEFSQWRFTVLEMQGVRISRVRAFHTPESGQ